MPIKSTDRNGFPGVVMLVQSLPPLPSGGAEIQALRLAEILKRKGIKVLFITPGMGKIKGYTEINGIPVYRLHSFLNLILDLLFFIQKKSPLKKEVIEYDDNMAENNTISRKIGFGARLRYSIFLFNARLFLKKRSKDFQLIHVHTLEWPAYVGAKLSISLNKKLLSKDSTMNGIYNILRYPSGLQKRKMIIEQSHFVAMTKVIYKNFISAGIPPDKISRIPNGISTEGHFKTRYEGNIKVLFVGNLYQQPAKGVDILLKCWVNAISKRPEIRLTIVGDGNLAAYRSFAESLGIGYSVQFTGKHNDVADLMISSDLFVLPSRREGMPNVLMEAMLRGLPCVASDISGCQDLITNGLNGILTPPKNTEALAQNLLHLLENRQEAEKMGRAARETILSSFDMNIIAGQYADLYSKLLNSDPENVGKK